ncbi:hypothetical protein ACFVS2_20445 [Brevibacillus sp. NPDC058079]|uniref:hypothetical protein n=1 Tax=Brevibacillus sp. NPDC058079 TaxID=3346330 RepID=UPI0036F02F8F
MKSKIAGKLIQKSEVEAILEENPNLNASEIGARLGVSREVIYEFYRQYGWGRKTKKSNTYGYSTKDCNRFVHVTAEDIVNLLSMNRNLTHEELADILGTSITTIERVKREAGIISDHKGRKIPMTEKELKDKIKYLILNTGMLRQEIAWELGVTPPTVGNYTKILKNEGEIPQDFSFRKRYLN